MLADQTQYCDSNPEKKNIKGAAFMEIPMSEWSPFAQGCPGVSWAGLAWLIKPAWVSTKFWFQQNRQIVL